MIESLLKLKHWQYFLFVCYGLILSNNEIESKTISLPLSIIGTLLYTIWPFFVGYGLYRILPKGIKFNYKLFIFNSIVFLFAAVAVPILIDRGIKYSGILPMTIGLYGIFAIFYYMIFPVRTLRSIEKGCRVSLFSCFGDMILVFILPLGIWFLQPRVNKLQEKSSID